MEPSFQVQVRELSRNSYRISKKKGEEKKKGYGQEIVQEEKESKLIMIL